MTKRKTQRWLPALLVAPVAAGLFGATTTWALANTPQPKQAESAALTTPTTGSASSSGIFGAGVSDELTAVATQNDSTILQLEQQVAQMQAKLETVRAASASLQSSPSSGSNASAPRTSPSWTAPTQPGPSAPQQAQPAPQTNSTTGAS